MRTIITSNTISIIVPSLRSGGVVTIVLIIRIDVVVLITSITPYVGVGPGRLPVRVMPYAPLMRGVLVVPAPLPGALDHIASVVLDMMIVLVVGVVQHAVQMTVVMDVPVVVNALVVGVGAVVLVVGIGVVVSSLIGVLTFLDITFATILQFL